MFDASSRYFNLENATLRVTEADGSQRLVVYKRRRFLPGRDQSTTLIEHSIKDGERLDNITAAYLGDPFSYWQVCDANGVLDPEDLVAEPGRLIKITIAGR